MKLDRQAVQRSFREYVSAYDAKDPKIALKIAHTCRVASLCETIAREDVPLADPDLSWLMGMLHDIGRFEQVRIYHTFIDSASVDHAMFGADLLFQEGLLTQLVPDAQQILTEKDRRILEISIRNHNRYRIEKSLTEEEQAYCHILRDADKIDIFRVNCDTPLQEIYNASTEELLNAGVSEDVKECFLRRTTVERAIRRTVTDHLVGHICLTFELVYPVSTRIAREQGYVDKLLSFRSENPETREWFDRMKELIWKTEDKT